MTCSGEHELKPVGLDWLGVQSMDVVVLTVEIMCIHPGRLHTNCATLISRCCLQIPMSRSEVCSVVLLYLRDAFRL